MSLRIANKSRHTSIKSIKISEPITIVVTIYIFHYSSFDGIHILHSGFSGKNCSLFTANSTSTVPYNFSSICHFFILFHKLWNFTEVYRPCRNRSFKMTKSVLIIISHIKNEVLIRFFFINNFLKFFWRKFFSIFLYFRFGNLCSHSNDFISNLYAHSGKFVTWNFGRLDIHIWNILEIGRYFEELTICPTLSGVSSNCRANSFSTDIYSPLQSKISRHIKMFLSYTIKFTLRNIDKFIKCKKCKLWLMPSI